MRDISQINFRTYICIQMYVSRCLADIYIYKRVVLGVVVLCCIVLLCLLSRLIM